MAKFHLVKSCCGSASWLFTMDKPITKGHLDLFKNASFQCPENYTKNGIFFVKKSAFVATASFGIRKVNARCGGANCDKIRDEFIKLLEQVEK